jgi:hypothetical protein
LRSLSSLTDEVEEAVARPEQPEVEQPEEEQRAVAALSSHVAAPRSEVSRPTVLQPRVVAGLSESVD